MLYDNIKVICKQRKISIAKLERILNLAAGSVHKWNVNEPGIWKVKKVADYLKVSIDELVE